MRSRTTCPFRDSGPDNISAGAAWFTNVAATHVSASARLPWLKISSNVRRTMTLFASSDMRLTPQLRQDRCVCASAREQATHFLVQVVRCSSSGRVARETIIALGGALRHSREQEWRQVAASTRMYLLLPSCLSSGRLRSGQSAFAGPGSVCR